MTHHNPGAAVPTTDPAAALEFCRRLAAHLAKEQELRWPAAGVESCETPEISVVIPLFNEAENVRELHQRLTASLSSAGVSYEIILVNDGSKDESPHLVEAITANDPHVVMLDLSRNFGHQVAISAGLELSTGNAVIIMDGDLQDPPEVLPQFIAKWREGYEVVYAVRQDRKEHLLKRISYATFYRVLQWIAHIPIPLDSGDFCIMDRRVVDLLIRMPERNRFLRGIRSWLGFRQIGLPYERHARHGGKPKYTFRKLLYLALDGLLSFSYMPLRIISILGLTVSLFSLVLAASYFVRKAFFSLDPPGFSTLVVAIFFLAGVELVTIGVMAEYVARISDEVKRRPLFVVRRIVRGQNVSRS